jgi:PEGA domain
MALRVVAIPLFAAICLASPAISSGEQARKGRGYSPRGGGSGETATRSGGDTARSGGGTATRSGGDANRRSGDGDRASTSNRAAERGESRPDERRAVTRAPEERRTESRTAERAEPATAAAEERRADRDDDGQRRAVRRDNGVVVNNAPRIFSRDARSNDYRDRAYYRAARNDWPRININIGSSNRGYYAPAHYDYWARRYYRWSPIGYAPWSLIYGSIGFPNYGFYGGIGPSPFYYGYNGSGYSYGPGIYAPYGGYPTYAYPHEAGGVRLKIRPRDAQVFVDGYYAGLVDDFDGVFQPLKLEAGGHKIEIRMPGFEDLALDVHVQPGRTVTLEEYLRPRP